MDKELGFPAGTDFNKKVQSHTSFPTTKTRNHRVWFIQAVLSLSLLAFLFHSQLKSLRLDTQPTKSTSKIVDEVLREVPFTDGHNDFPLFIRAINQNHLYDGYITSNSTIYGQVDFPASVEVEQELCSGKDTSQDDAWPDSEYWQTMHFTFQQIDLVNRMISEFSDDLVAASTAQDVWANHRKSSRIASLMGVEGLHSIANSPSILRLYHQLGVRYATLTHFCHNRYADSASQKPYWHGLSDDGKALISEMNRIGMMVDLSHTSADTQRQALDHTDIPVIFSHATSYEVCPHPRNVADDVLWKLKKNNGVIMVDFVKEYVNCKNPENATLADVADHIQHIGELIGYEHLGIGSDYDGMEGAPEGLADVSKYPAILGEMAARGVGKKELKGIAGANILRVLKDVEDATKRFRHVKPLEDKIKKIHFED